MTVAVALDAVRFSPSHGTIEVKTSVTDLWIHVDVLDEGPGIPADEMESIFEKFVQSSATKTGAGGTGLGLAICREIMLAHGGSIWAENRRLGIVHG